MKNYTQATAEGFVHMSQPAYHKLFDEQKNRDMVQKFLDEATQSFFKPGPDFNPQTDWVKFKAEFNGGCAHGHHKSCIRIEATLSFHKGNAQKAVLCLMGRVLPKIANVVSDEDLEVQIHRVRLMGTQTDDGQKWVRPDNYDPAKGPRKHGC